MIYWIWALGLMGVLMVLVGLYSAYQSMAENWDRRSAIYGFLLIGIGIALFGWGIHLHVNFGTV